jgi:hypothetical protein
MLKVAALCRKVLPEGDRSISSEQEGNEHLGLLDVTLIGGAEKAYVLLFLRFGGCHQKNGCCKSKDAG